MSGERTQSITERPSQRNGGPGDYLKQLTIFQFNCGAANYGVSRPIFDAVTPEAHNILAIQEPAYNNRTMTTYCPRGYKLAYDPNPTTKVCFLVGDRIHSSHWSYQAHSPYVASLRVQATDGPIELINVYNPRGNGPRISTWTTIEKVIEAAPGRVILLGDFNAHHSEWGGIQALCEAQSEHLLIETQRWDLHLLNPKGVATWKRGQRESVIDLVFASGSLKESVIHCRPREDWAVAQDHIPIDLCFNVETLPRPPCKRFAISKLDRPGLIKHIEATNWQNQTNPLDALQRALGEGLEINCPRVRPSPRASRKWSPRASELLAGARRARRAYATSGMPHDLQAQMSFQNLLKKELRKGNRTMWRKFVEEITSDPGLPHNKGLWKLSKWSRSMANGAQTAQMPPLRRSRTDPLKTSNEEKAELLREKLFPHPPRPDLSDIPSNWEPTSQLAISPEVSADQVASAIAGLSSGKAAGPDGIPNELLKALAPDIKEDLARAISELFSKGSLPTAYKESLTAVLRKEQKDDYSLPGNYRPIALQNSLAKLVEKIVADRITETVEKENLLPWNQMGARKKRSTLSAIDLLIGSVQTAWKARPGCVVSMLSLDISGAFPNTSHERLEWVLKQKGFPYWVTRFVVDFLHGRRTKLMFSGFESEWFPMETGIPQGSPLSPILFLLFIAELLDSLQRPGDATLGFGFVDDTNLIAWGDSARENCQRLKLAHDKCIAWAKRYGAKFAPDKYKLIHFTKKRRDPSGDLASSVRIDGNEIGPESKLRVLGVWMDPKMDWKEHVKKQVARGTAAFESLARIATSTWGPSMRKARLIYSAAVRPAMMYGAQAWGTQDGKVAKASIMRPLKMVQNKCLRRITGAYKRTPTAALEREADIPPLDLHVETIALQRAESTADHAVYGNIREAHNYIWSQMREAARGPARRNNVAPSARPPTDLERARQVARERIREVQREDDEENGNQRRSTRPRRGREGGRPRRLRRGGPGQAVPRREKPKQPLAEWADREWKKRWMHIAAGKQATTWKTPWETNPSVLYSNLPKHQSTALMLLRTEVIGLNDWLSSVGVPDVLPRCNCGWPRQTARHVVMQCRTYEGQRAELIREAGSEDFRAILTGVASARAAARWFVRCGILAQFRTAYEVDCENTAAYVPFRTLD